MSAERVDSDLVTRFLGTQSCAPQVGSSVTTEDCRCRHLNGDGSAISDCPDCSGTGSVVVGEAICSDCGEEGHAHCTRGHWHAGPLGADQFCADCEDEVHVTQCRWCDEAAVNPDAVLVDRRCESCAETDKRVQKRERMLAQEGWI